MALNVPGLLMLAYDERRDVARGMIKNDRPGQTLQPTALVHEAYLRVAGDDDPQWQGRRHFFAASSLLDAAHPHRAGSTQVAQEPRW